MEKIYIQGGEPLSGSVAVGGSKNDSVAIMAAALLVPGKTILRNVPRISDVQTLLEIFQHLGAPSHFRDDGALEIDATRLTTSETPHEVVRKMRASFNVLGALLTRFGHACVAMPGGCDIGARPVNFHIKGLEALGARLNLEHGIYVGEAKRLTGANIYLEFPSAGATQHLMIAASCARGRTVIENCAAEPEVQDLAHFLTACGARIEGAGTTRIIIEGVEELHPADFAIIPDRLQAGTYAIAAAITGGDVTLENAVYDHSRPVFAKLAACGAEVTSVPEGIRVRRVGSLHPAEIKTLPHPGFPTDMQQPLPRFSRLLPVSPQSPKRSMKAASRYTTELARMGADIQVEDRTAIIRGVPRLNGASVTCTDLRGGAAVVVAGLVAEGETEIDGLTHLDRGYENIVPNLRSLGARIHREQEVAI